MLKIVNMPKHSILQVGGCVVELTLMHLLASLTSSGRIRIWILPGDDPEPEEVFLVSFVTASGGAVFDPNAPARVIITQRGMPFGVVGFAGEALDPRVFVEGNTTMQAHFPVSRTEGALGTVEVSADCFH